MTITEMYRCRGKRGYIKGTPYGTAPEITGFVECLGFEDYIHVNEVSGERQRVTMVAVRLQPANSKFGCSYHIDRKHVELIE